jgi:hypothetical protein
MAGKAFAGLGTATMVAGMSTQVEGRVGEIAQQVVGPLAALSGIAPLLMALPAPIAALVAVVAAGVLGFMAYNKAVNEAYQKAYELTRALGTSTQAMNKFAEFAGTVSAGEILERQRNERMSPFTVAPGKTTFGSAFVQSEDGQEFVNTVKTSIQELGKDKTIAMVFQQMGSAVAQNILTAEQARSIVGNLGLQLGDLSFTAEVNAQLISLLGANGENLLKDPLQIAVQLNQVQAETLEKDIAEYEGQRELLAFEEAGFVESTQRVLADILPAWSPAGSLLNMSGITRTDENYNASVQAERQRRIDSGEVEGGFEEFMLAITPGTWIAKQIMQESLGNVSANLQNSLEGQQAAIDQIRLSSEEKIAKALEEGADFSEIQELRREESELIAEANKQIREQTQKSIDFIKTLSVGDQKEVQDQQKDRLIAQGKEQGIDTGSLGAAFDKLFKTGSFDKNFVISSAYEAGQLSLSDFQYLAELEDQQKDIYYNIITNLGAGEAGQLVEVANLIKDDSIRANFELSFEGLEGSELTDAIAGAEELFKISTMMGGDISIAAQFSLDNPEAMKEFTSDLERIKMEAKEGGFDANISLVTEIFGAERVMQMQQGILANQAEFDALGDDMQLKYSAYYTLFADIAASSPEMQEMMEAATGLTGGAAIAAYVMDYLPSIAPDTSMAPDSETTPSGSGGGGAEPQVDSLIKKLRDLRIATIDMKKGWEGMQQVLEKVFAGGSKGIDVFDGLSNQIRRMGVGENLIEMIVGMDPDEYQKRKGELFVFDKAGNIVGTTAKLKNMNAAFNAIAIGEYINNQQSFIENIKNQSAAISILTANGMSLSEAYELVQDEALAAAIAMGATKAEIQEILRITKMAQEMKERNEEQEKRSQASKAVRETNEQFERRVAIINRLAKAVGKYSDEEINAILGDDNLQKLFLDPSIDPKALRRALENARRQADLDLKIKVSTEEGKEGLFNEMVSEITDEFSRQESKINIAFDLATEDDQDIVREAQNRISAIQFAIDDYEAQLRGIGDQEDEINDKYDDRFEALDKVAKANERIAASQKAQLNIADALSRGDIAAAAQAQQEFRAQQAQDAAESQKEKLEKQKEAELKNVRSASGMSREEIEERVKSLQDEIFGIEEDQLEPAQERIRIAEYNRDLQLDALEISGKTRSEWEQIANQVDIATTNTEEFAKSVQKALALYDYFVNGKDLDLSLFGGMLEDLQSVGVDVSSQVARGAATVVRDLPRGTEEEDPVSTNALNEFTSKAFQKFLTGGAQTLSEIEKVLVGIGPVSRAQASADALRALTGGSSLTQEQRFLLGMAPSPYAPPTPPSPIPGSSSSSSGGGRNPGNTDPADLPPVRLPSGGTRQPVAVPIGGGRYIYVNQGGMIKPQRFSVGGGVKGYSSGGSPLGSDIVPAMLTPGEFVVRKRAVQDFGMKNLEKINSGSFSSGSVYNYSLAVNVKSDADPDRIAKTVIQQIKRVDSQRVKGNRF